MPLQPEIKKILCCASRAEGAAKGAVRAEGAARDVKEVTQAILSSRTGMNLEVAREIAQLSDDYADQAARLSDEYADRIQELIANL